MRPTIACECGAYVPLRADHVGPTVFCPECHRVLLGTDRFRRRARDVLLGLKDPASMLTHAVGVLLGAAALVLLVTFASRHATAWHVVGFAIYGASLVLLYGASTLYHWLDLSRRGNALLQRFDQMMIFVLIAGTYTPVCLVTLRGGWGWSILGVVWGLTVAGWLMAHLWQQAPDWMWAAVYLAMGWVGMVALWPMVQAFHGTGLAWLFLGGGGYTLGALVFAMRWPNPARWFAHHEVFHVLTLAGSVSHYFLMQNHVLWQ